MSGQAAAELPFYIAGEANPPKASPLAFTALLPKQKHSHAKSRQLRRLHIEDSQGVSLGEIPHDVNGTSG